jgi:hypothetical protein
MKARILRWNRLKRRAAALGVDVQTLIRIDAAAQRELLLEADDDGRSGRDSSRCSRSGVIIGQTLQAFDSSRNKGTVIRVRREQLMPDS